MSGLANNFGASGGWEQVLGGLDAVTKEVHEAPDVYHNPANAIRELTFAVVLERANRLREMVETRLSPGTLALEAVTE